MAYCDECGTKNEDDAGYCSKCGKPLKEENNHRPRNYRRRQRDECFGLPFGNIIVPIIIGIVLIMIGLSSIYGFSVWQYLWPAIVIVVGLLIIIGAIYRTRRKD